MVVACLVPLSSGTVLARNITGQDWGTSANGEKVSL